MRDTRHFAIQGVSHNQHALYQKVSELRHKLSAMLDTFYIIYTPGIQNTFYVCMHVSYVYVCMYLTCVCVCMCVCVRRSGWAEDAGGEGVGRGRGA